MSEQQILRVVVAAMPRIVAEIVCSVLDADDGIEVEGPLDPGTDLIDLLRRQPPAALVVRHEAPELSQETRELLLTLPTLSIFAIRQNMNRCWVHRLAPTTDTLAALSPETLAEEIRRHAFTWDPIP